MAARNSRTLRAIEEPSAADAGASTADKFSTHMDESIAPSHDLSAPDFGPAPKDYREQAISAYRNGDLYLALIKLDLAISLDPKSSDAYVDRGIVLHRLGDMKRARADIAKAKQIDDSKSTLDTIACPPKPRHTKSMGSPRVHELCIQVQGMPGRSGFDRGVMR